MRLLCFALLALALCSEAALTASFGKSLESLSGDLAYEYTPGDLEVVMYIRFSQPVLVEASWLRVAGRQTPLSQHSLTRLDQSTYRCAFAPSRGTDYEIRIPASSVMAISGHAQLASTYVVSINAN
jgi:hypothetical protein